MEEIIQKIKDLYAALTIKFAEVSELMADLKLGVKDQEAQRMALVERERLIKIREDAIKPIEDVIALQEKIDHVSITLGQQKAEFIKEKKVYQIEHDHFIQDQSSKIAELDKMKGIYQNKVALVDAELKAIEERKK